MQNFSPLASKLREEIEAKDGRTLTIQKFTVFVKNSSGLRSGPNEFVVFAQGGLCIFQRAKNDIYFIIFLCI